MKLTFGIVTSIQSQYFLNGCIRSITELSGLNVSDFEIVIIGGEHVLEQLNSNIPSFNVCSIKSIPFNENVKNGWITKKKNLITENASSDIIIYCHDYLVFDKDWYLEWDKFGWNWDIAMNRIETHIGDRAVDWMGLPTDKKYGNVLLPYDYNNLKGMYIPGNFWLAKKEIMVKYPLDERLVWGQSEDIEWSKRVLGGNNEKNEWLRNLTHKSLEEEIDESKINKKRQRFR